VAEFTVVGASGRTGRRLVARLLDQGHEVVAVGRDAERMRALPDAAERRLADLRDGAALDAALAGARTVISCAPPRHIAQLLAHVPATLARLVVIGSTRKFTRYPDRIAREVWDGEAAWRAADVPGVLLHPTMIYGGEGTSVVQRLSSLIRLLRVVPLPEGGRYLVQPVHVDDLVSALIAAATRPDLPRAAIVVAGPEPMRFADLVRTCGAAIGRPAVVVPVPLRVALGLTRVLALLPERLRVTPDEVRRLTEDKAFEIDDMRRHLGVEPMPFRDGISQELGH
jgi:uncharacterized protein YbjT (DUF2867 family)